MSRLSFPGCTATVVLFWLSYLGCPVPVVNVPAICSDMSRLTCLGLPIHAVLSRLTCPGCPVPASLSWLSCPGCPVTVFLSQLSCPSFSVLVIYQPYYPSSSKPFPSAPSRLTCLDWPIPPVLSKMSCLNCPAMVVVSQLSRPSCPDVIFWTSRPLFPVLAVLSPERPLGLSCCQLSRLSYPGSPVCPVLTTLCPTCPVLVVQFQMPCPDCPVPATLLSLSCPGFPKLSFHGCTVSKSTS